MKRNASGRSDLSQTLEVSPESGDQFRLAFEQAPTGMIVSDLRGRFVHVNQAMAELLGYSIQQLADMGFQEITHPEDFDKDLFLVSELLKGRKTRFVMDKRCVRESGEIIHITLHGSLVRDARGRPVNFIGQIVDVTEQRNYEQAMRHMAYHDQLTGLPNRILFREKLEVSLAKAKANQDMLAVIFLDLDNFKIINDTLGHYSGDLALKQIAERLINSVRINDVVARLGGDEFTVALSSVVQEQDVSKILQKIIESLEKPLLLEERDFTVSASVGIALHPRDGQDVDALLRVADTAMYMSKRRKGVNN